MGAILGLCLLLFALVIFAPVRYQIRGSVKEEVVYSFKFSWLLSLISIRKKETSDQVRLYVCGIPVRRLAGSKKETTKEEKRKSADADSVEAETDEKKVEIKPVKEKRERKSGEPGKRKRIIKKTSGKKRKRKKAFSFRKVSSIIGCVKQDKKAVKRLFREIRELVHYLAPTRIGGEMIVGTGDPASTGLALGVISLFPAVYQEGVRIRPDFEEKRFEAKGYVKGRIRVIYFLRLLFRLYKDRELKHLWKQINKVKKEAA